MNRQKATIAQRHRFEYMAVLLSVALLASVLVHTGATQALDRSLQSLVQSVLPEARTTDLLLVELPVNREVSAAENGEGAQQAARLVDAMRDAGARALVLDLPWSGDSVTPGQAELARVMEEWGRVYLPVYPGREGFRLEEAMPPVPLAGAARAVGHGQLEVDGDGFARGFSVHARLGGASWRHLSVLLLEEFHPERLAGSAFAEDAGATAGTGRDYYMVPFGSGILPHRVSADELLAGNVDEDMLRNRIVFAGNPDPFARGWRVMRDGRPDTLASMEAHAAVFAALRDGLLVRPLGTPAVWALTLALALALAAVLPWLQPRWALPLTLGTLGLILVLALTLLQGPRFWFPPGAALVSALVALPLWNWRRLAWSSAHLRAAMARAPAPGAQARRVAEAAEPEALVRMLRGTLPLDGWRLVRPADRWALASEMELPEYTWQGARARHYSFHHGGHWYELSLVWQQTDPPAVLEERVRRMVRRCHAEEAQARMPTEVMVAWMADVEERRRQRRALAVMLQTTLEAMPQAVVTCDLCGTLLHANGRAKQWLALPAEDCAMPHLLELGADLYLAGGEEEDWSDLVHQALGGADVLRRCFRGKREMVLEITCREMADSGEELLVVTFTELEHWRGTRRDPSSLLAPLSHDLRSPLVSILSLCERGDSQERSPDQWARDVSAQARKGVESAERFLHLVRAELLDPGRLGPVDMLAVLDEALEQGRVLADDREVSLRFDHDPDQAAWVRGDEALLQQSLWALLSAAISSAQPGSRLEVSLGASRSRVACGIRVPDAGHREPWFRELLQGSPGGEQPAGAAAQQLCLAALTFERHGGTVHVWRLPGAVLGLEAELPATEPE